MKRVLALVAFAALALGLAVQASASGHRLTAADRKAIDHTLGILINNAVKRHDIGKSYEIVTPTLKAGMTRREWSRGSIPIYPYPARASNFHNAWTVKYTTPGEIAVELVLHPRRGSKLGAIEFDVYLQPHHDKWLVDELMPVATFAPEGGPARVTALNDFMPVTGSKPDSAPTHPGRISSIYAFVPFGIMGIVLIALALGLVAGALRYRPRSGSLPPFPGVRRAPR
jgi:hypothetical protein